MRPEALVNNPNQEAIVLSDCNDIVYNVFETNAEAYTHYTALVVMSNEGATEDEIYAELKRITSTEAESLEN